MPDLSLRHRSGALLAAGAVLALTAPAAQAAYTVAGEVAGPDTGPGIVTGGTAGQVAIAGRTLTGALVGAGHAPGGAFSAAGPVANGSDDEPATFGTGGAVTNTEDLGPAARRLRADGSVSDAVLLGGPGAVPVGTPAVAPGGALLAAVIDADGDLQLWRQAGEGQPAAPLLATLPDDASTVDIEPLGADGFLVVLAAPAVDGAGTRVRAVTVDGTTASGLRVVDDLDTGSATLVQAVPGAAGSFATYLATEGDSSTLRASALSTPAPAAPKVLAEAGGEDSIDDVRGLSLAGGGAAVAWTSSDAEGVSTSAYAVLDGSATATCTRGVPFVAVRLVDRGGPLLVGLDGAERVATVPVQGGCPPPAASAGSTVADGVELEAAVDADGTLVVAVARGGAGPAAIVVDDVTAPAAGPLTAPAEVRPQTSFPASVEASDPWGVAGIAWTVDGESIPGGTSVTVPGRPEGTARLAATVTNAAGLTAEARADVRVRAEAAPTPPTTTTTPAPPPPAPTPPAPAPPAPPVTAQDTKAPVLSGVRLQRSLVRPRAVGVALPRGTALAFAVDEAARYRVTLLRETPRPGARSRCDVRGGRPGGTTGRKLELQGDAPVGITRLAITGRDREGRRLPRGRYRVSVRVIDAAGNWSPTRYVRFTLC